MTAWQASIQRWRALSSEQRTQAAWRRIPRQVAQSMAFEGEPVDLQWLTTTRPAHATRAIETTRGFLRKGQLGQIRSVPLTNRRRAQKRCESMELERGIAS